MSGMSGATADPVHVRLGSLDIRLSASDPSLAQLLRDLWIDSRADPNSRPGMTVDFRREGFGTNTEHILEVDGRRVLKHGSPGLLLDRAIRMATQEAARRSADSIPLHGAAIARDGQGVILVGPSGTGKSTLAADLVQRGWDFLSDEVALIDVAGMDLRAVPRPIMLAPDSVAAIPGLRARIPEELQALRHFEHHLTSGCLRPGSLVGTARADLIVWPSFVASSPLSTTELTRGEALMRLVGMTFESARSERQVVQDLARLLVLAEPIHLSYGDLGEAASWLELRLAVTRDGSRT